jgi:hypothetical protein
MRIHWRGPALLLLLLLAPAAVWAGSVGEGFDFTIAVSGPDRAVVAWINAYDTYQWEVRATAFASDGNPVPGWSVLVSSLPARDAYVRVAGDGAGGAFVAWLNGINATWTVRLLHIDSAGAIAEGWRRDGVLLGSASQVPPAVASDGAGGVLIGWTDGYGPGLFGRIQHFDGAGMPAPDWPAEGITIPRSYLMALVADSDRHFYVSTVGVGETPMPSVRVHRFDEYGTPDPTWPAAGALQGSGPVGSSALYLDGAGGVFSVWGDAQAVCFDAPCGRYQEDHALRFRGDGAPVDGWGTGRKGDTISPDQSGGLLVGHFTDGRPAVTRLDAGGAPMPGWAPDGSYAMSEHVYSVDRVYVTGDGAGGAFAVWVDRRTGQDGVYSSHLDANGQLAAGWPATGSHIGFDGSDIQLASVGNGVALMLAESPNPAGHPAAFITVLRPGTPGPVVDAGPAGLEVLSNPVSGPIVAMVSIPTGGAAQVDLVDTAGRKVESQAVSLPAHGSTALQFNVESRLPAGVYWLRMSQAGRVSSKKVAVLQR